MKILSLADWKKRVADKYKGEVRVLSSRHNGRQGVDLLLKVGTEKGWVSTRTLADRSLAKTLLLPKSTQIKTAIREKHRQRSIESAIKMANSRLASWGLNEFTVKYGPRQTLSFTQGNCSLTMGVTHFRNNTKSRRSFLCRFFAYKRFGLKTPLAYTDAEWRARVEKATDGRITASRYFPVASGQPHRLQCTRCGLAFEKVRVFNKVNAVINCPECDVKQNKNYSKAAIAWLRDLESRLGFDIQTAASPKGEKKIQLADGTTTCVDGFAKNIVFEYHGSRWHGNPTLFYLDETPDPRIKLTAGELLTRTLRREKSIQAAGYKLVRIWDTSFLNESEYNTWLLKNLKRIKKYLSTKQ